MNYLDGINSPKDIKKLNIDELEALCGEIREFMIDSVSKTGGHLASNLGVVELTVAIHKVFSSPTDQIVFDVGHQCYTHKILTGRKNDFSTLRQEDGISGFTKAAFVGVGYGLTMPILMPLFAMITVAAIPRIINLYEGKVDVRPIITKLLGYYILLALPLVVIMSIYSMDYTLLLKTNPKFYEACTLVPYFSFGVFFLGLTDYTTLQYHLANKTHIEFIIKLISGIVGVILNLVLIAKMGLVGVGIATLAANFLYFLLSAIIVLPDFNLKLPKNTLIRILLASIPAVLLYSLFRFGGVNVSGTIKIFSVMIIFYAVYALLKLKIYKTSD